MRPYTSRLKEIEGALREVHRSVRPDAAFDPIEARDAVLDGTAAQAFDAVWSPLRRGVPPSRIARALVGAPSHRLLRFDDRIDRDPDVAEGWLWATHRLTFASAVRHAVGERDAPDALRFLFQAAAFIHSGRRMDGGPDLLSEPPVPEGGPEDVAGAIRSRDAASALALTRGYLRSGRGFQQLARVLEEVSLEPPLVRPIFVTHAIKTTFAAIDEHEALARHPDRDVPLLAAVRFLASPVVERRIPAEVRTSLRWVVEGVVPRKLTQ